MLTSETLTAYTLLPTAILRHTVTVDAHISAARWHMLVTVTPCVVRLALARVVSVRLSDACAVDARLWRAGQRCLAVCSRVMGRTLTGVGVTRGLTQSAVLTGGASAWDKCLAQISGTGGGTVAGEGRSTWLACSAVQTGLFQARLKWCLASLSCWSHDEKVKRYNITMKVNRNINLKSEKIHNCERRYIQLKK